MNESATGTPSETRDDALRIGPATIDDLPELTRLVMELFEG